MGMFVDKTITILKKSMDTASLRQNVIAHNIANVNTPGYKRSFVSFEEKLQEALGEKKKIKLAAYLPGHFGNKQVKDVQPEVKKDKATSLREDGNNVDMDTEMAQLAMNSINYQMAVNRLNGKLGTLRYVINEGRR